MSILKIPCRYRRLLREYRRVAHVNHGLCPMCQRHIQPGEDYYGYVYLTETGIRVEKWHVFCPDDFWREEEEEMKRMLARMEAEEAAAALAAAA